MFVALNIVELDSTTFGASNPANASSNPLTAGASRAAGIAIAASDANG